MRDRGLQGIEAVVERQQRVLAEGHDNGLVPADRTVDFGVVGPVGRSLTEVRRFHFATVFGLMPWRPARTLRLS